MQVLDPKTNSVRGGRHKSRPGGLFLGVDIGYPVAWATLHGDTLDRVGKATPEAQEGGFTPKDGIPDEHRLQVVRHGLTTARGQPRLPLRPQLSCYRWGTLLGSTHAISCPAKSLPRMASSALSPPQTDESCAAF